MWRNDGRHLFRFLQFALCATLISGCEATFGPDSLGKLDREHGGLVVAEESQAVRIAHDILLVGGTAADAAVALGFGLTVSLPSSAGLGGGGMCLVYDAEVGTAQVLDFLPKPAKGQADIAERQVAVPATARGLYALHSRYGRIPWSQVVLPAENLARAGSIVSRALAHDLAEGAGALLNDGRALDQFMPGGRSVAQEGDRLDQSGLAVTMSGIRVGTPKYYYSAEVSESFDRSSKLAGVSVVAGDIRRYKPSWADVEAKQMGSLYVFRAVGQLSHLTEELNSSGLVAMAAATGFAVADFEGNAVACGLTMVTPFGVGIMPPGFGFLFAPSPTDSLENFLPLIIDIAVDSIISDVVYAAAPVAIGSVQSMESDIQSVFSDDLSSLYDFSSPPSGEGVTRSNVFNAFYCDAGVRRDIERCTVKNDPADLGFGIIVMKER
jgi:gamma-glutamyltranspeptidase / glutathione hydrolase